jgi:hypothetical protein
MDIINIGADNCLVCRFLRFQKEYTPPNDAEERILSLARSAVTSLRKTDEADLRSFKLDDSRIKFDLLSRIFTEFNHSIPNSMLYMVTTVGEFLAFVCRIHMGFR